MKKIFLTALIYSLSLCLIAHTEEIPVKSTSGKSSDNPIDLSGITIKKDIPYIDDRDASDYEKQSCRLDIYIPDDSRNRASAPGIVWFHGGGLTGGSKSNNETLATAAWLAHHGIVVAATEYRFSPKVRFPAYVQDSARAVSWVKKHGKEFGIDTNKLYIGGYSAGAYLSSMLVMDESYLKACGIENNDLSGAISVSGQMVTHFTVMSEEGYQKGGIISDKASPAFYTRANTIPFLILVGDNDFPARLEENQYFAAALRVAGNKQFKLHVIANREHDTMILKLSEENDPAGAQALKFIESGINGQ